MVSSVPRKALCVVETGARGRFQAASDIYLNPDSTTTATRSECRHIWILLIRVLIKSPNLQSDCIGLSVALEIAHGVLTKQGVASNTRNSVQGRFLVLVSSQFGLYPCQGSVLLKSSRAYVRRYLSGGLCPGIGMLLRGVPSPRLAMWPSGKRQQVEAERFGCACASERGWIQGLDWSPSRGPGAVLSSVILNSETQTLEFHHPRIYPGSASALYLLSTAAGRSRGDRENPH